MKKFTTLMLALALCAGLCIPASAAKTVASTQNLSVDGAVVDCEKYNIDGANYFKLRDLAALLNGSLAQFSVGYDAEKNAVTVATGGIYEYNGSELAIGADKSATAVESRQSITINGEAVTGVSVYNIGGNNYFKLRDLADALGFEVGYDEATRTATVSTAPFSETTVYTYDAKGNCVSEYTTDAGEGARTLIYTYDAAGNLLTETYTYDDDQPGYLTTNTYDAAGNLTSSAQKFLYGGDVEITNYTYDAAGNCVTEEYIGEGYTLRIANTCDAAGNIILQKYENESESWQIAYTYDAAGNCLTAAATAITGEDISDYTITSTYDANGNELTQKYESAIYTSESVNTYDAHNNVVTHTFSTSDGLVMHDNYRYAYDAAGRMVWRECESEMTGGTTTTVNIYNAAGQLVLMRQYTAMG